MGGGGGEETPSSVLLESKLHLAYIISHLYKAHQLKSGAHIIPLLGLDRLSKKTKKTKTTSNTKKTLSVHKFFTNGNICS